MSMRRPAQSWATAGKNFFPWAYSTLTRRLPILQSKLPWRSWGNRDAGDGSIYRRKDGIAFPVEVSMRRVRLERDYIIAIIRDLTERKLAEARLQASQDRYREVFDRSPVGICWVETKTGRLLMVNPKYCEILGRTEQDLLSRNFPEHHTPRRPGGESRQAAAARGRGVPAFRNGKKVSPPGWFGSLGGDRGCGNVAGGWNPSFGTWP